MVVGTWSFLDHPLFVWLRDRIQETVDTVKDHPVQGQVSKTGCHDQEQASRSHQDAQKSRKNNPQRNSFLTRICSPRYWKKCRHTLSG